MRFLVDAQLPPALATFLNSSGHHAEHVAMLGLASATDSIIWSYAEENQAIIISKDEDFANRIALHPEGPPIVWIRIGNTGNRALLEWFGPMLPVLEKALIAGEKLIELV
jgi:predicted nuclease of predicted toxin-antitoxin system